MTMAVTNWSYEGKPCRRESIMKKKRNREIENENSSREWIETNINVISNV